MDPDDRSAHYLNIVIENLSGIAEVLQRLAAARGCSAVHCYAAVDRTGVTMALLGEVLGVTRDLLLQDYVASAADLHRYSLSKLFGALDDGAELANYRQLP
jgi:protein tyrosine/serine phosphatase